MRRLITIIAVTLVVAACARPDDDNARIQIDDDLGVVDEDTTAPVELPLLEGELVASPTRDDVETVRISDAGEFLFVVQDDQWFAWIGKEATVAIEFASWPDPTRPDDGPPSIDVTFDDTYLWFLSEYDGGWNLAGVEHFLGSASPLFGQPIIIIDLGPIQKPRGVERYGEKFVIPTDPDLDGGSGRLIIVGENLPLTDIQLPGAPRSDRFDGWLSSKLDDRFYLSSFDDSSDVFRQRWESDVAPLAFATDDQVPYVIRQNGELWEEGDEVFVADAAPSDNPLIAVHASVVAWTSIDGIRVYDGEVRRIDATDVDALVVDDTHVWWSNAMGIHRASTN